MKCKSDYPANPVRRLISLRAEQLFEILTAMRAIIEPVVARGDLQPGEAAAMSAGVVFLDDLHTEMWNLQLNVNNDGRSGWPPVRIPEPHPLERRYLQSLESSRAREAVVTTRLQDDDPETER